MRFVIMIHSNPQPWGHPTSDHTSEYQALPQAEQDRLGADWERVFGEADANGEILYGCALGDPAAARIFGADRTALPTDGPYAEGKEHLAGFFVIEVADRERAEQIANAFACPGDTIELRPVMAPGCEA